MIGKQADRAGGRHEGQQPEYCYGFQVLINYISPALERDKLTGRIKPALKQSLVWLTDLKTRKLTKMISSALSRTIHITRGQAHILISAPQKTSFARRLTSFVLGESRQKQAATSTKHITSHRLTMASRTKTQNANIDPLFRY